ncbi:MAG: SurA N-terminal domain-containing protein [Deltaproteobacteria bacterium]|nr:SurA N-terminal domain-containing protein [Deltaproteobacteria bacterium]
MSRPWLFGGGMLAGAALAVFYIVRVPDAVEPTTDAVAWVNDRPISRASYENALQAVAGDRKSGTLREDDRERVLQRLIDQELLIDRAMELGLPERDPQIRNQLATAMIAFLVRRAEDEAMVAGEAELRAFYDEQRFRFERSAQYRVAVEGGAVPLPGGLLLAKEIEQRLGPSAARPGGLLLAKEIEQRLGPSAARKVIELEVGESVVVGEGAGRYIVHLLERRDGVLVPFDEARDAVEAAYLRDRSEVAVREFLEVARQHTDIRVEAER